MEKNTSQKSNSNSRRLHSNSIKSRVHKHNTVATDTLLSKQSKHHKPKSKLNEKTRAPQHSSHKSSVTKNKPEAAYLRRIGMEPEQTSEATDSYDAAKIQKSSRATLDFSSSGSEDSGSEILPAENQMGNKSSTQMFDNYRRRKPQLQETSLDIVSPELSTTFEIQGANFLITAIFS